GLRRSQRKHGERRHKSIRQGNVDTCATRVWDVGEAAADDVKERIGREMLPYVRRHDGHGQPRHENSTIEFITIKPSAATRSRAPGNYAGHSTVPSPDPGRPPSTRAS